MNFSENDAGKTSAEAELQITTNLFTRALEIQFFEPTRLRPVICSYHRAVTLHPLDFTQHCFVWSEHTIQAWHWYCVQDAAASQWKAFGTKHAQVYRKPPAMPTKNQKSLHRASILENASDVDLVDPGEANQAM
jgi:hypothetical protein